jgi:hypothetical protein
MEESKQQAQKWKHTVRDMPAPSALNCSASCMASSLCSAHTQGLEYAPGNNAQGMSVETMHSHV